MNSRVRPAGAHEVVLRVCADASTGSYAGTGSRGSPRDGSGSRGGAGARSGAGAGGAGTAGRSGSTRMRRDGPGRSRASGGTIEP
jgi:hypothetical protein